MSSNVEQRTTKVQASASACPECGGSNRVRRAIYALTRHGWVNITMLPEPAPRGQESAKVLAGVFCRDCGHTALFGVEFSELSKWRGES